MGGRNSSEKAYTITDDNLKRFLHIHFVKQSRLPDGVPVGFEFLMRDKSRIMISGKDKVFVDRVLRSCFYKDSDYYITANSFSSPRFRNSEHIFSLHNIVIDCDAHGIADAKQCRDLCSALRRDLIAAEFSKLRLPTPNSIVCTGRGIQLWWSLNPVTMKTADLYQRLSRYFCNVIGSYIKQNSLYSSFYVDGAASNNKAGIFRLPGTYNSKTGSQSNVIVLSDKIYNMFDLKSLIPHKTSCKQNRRRCRSKGSCIHGSIQSKGWKNADTAGFLLGRAESIAKLVALREYEVEGMRDLILWLYHNDLIKCLGPVMAFQEASALNARFSEPLSDKDLEQKLAPNETAVNYIDGGQGYAITTRYIIERLQITSDECEEIGLKKLSSSSTPRRKKSSQSRDIARQKRNRRKRNRVSRILMAAKRWESQTSIARRFGISRATVNRLVKSAGIADSIRHTNALVKASRAIIKKKKESARNDSAYRTPKDISVYNKSCNSSSSAILIFSYDAMNDLRDQR